MTPTLSIIVPVRNRGSRFAGLFELGYRLKMAGFRIRIEKSLQVKHFKRWSVRSMLKTDLFDRAIPWTVLILSSKGFISDLNANTSSGLGFVIGFASWKIRRLGKT